MTITAPNDPDEVTEIMIPNWTAFEALIACQTQWRVVATFGGLIWLGLDYTACRIALDAHGFAPSVFADLQVMENAVLPILNSSEDEE